MPFLKGDRYGDMIDNKTTIPEKPKDKDVETNGCHTCD